MPIPGAQKSSSCATPAAAGGSLSLPVLEVKGKGRRVGKSRMGRWRAAVLLGVHLVIAAHISLWFLTGMRETISPVEPSEAMYTLESGLVNAGFVFFLLALVSTAIMGRFFCGWGCHVVALQDLCSWIMGRLGIRPKPFRSRLLIWAPLCLALYMFVWPTLKREVVRPLAEQAGVWQKWAAFFEPVPPPVFHSGGAGLSFFKQEFTKAEFWETFPAWYIAIPFLLVCGFAIVYFMGSKAFCTYGCPYGGFFAPLDKLAPGRIRVTDACEHCGHCTAVCTSNVRVHEEVRDYGMVVDPGCMKCMDCISVCPNDALYFGMGRPSAFAKPRNITTETRRGKPRFKHRMYDLTAGEEVVFAAVFLGMILGFRGMLSQVPLLMAMGLGAIGTYLLWKSWRMLRDANVRMHNAQLKLKGRVRAAGVITAAVALGMAASAGWSGVVRYSHWRAAVLDQQIQAPYEEVFGKGYAAQGGGAAEKAAAALAHFRRGNRPADGGIGWPRGTAREVEVHRRMAWLSAVKGDFGGAERHIERALEVANEDPSISVQDLLSGLGRIWQNREEGLPWVIQKVETLSEQSPALHELKMLLAQLYMHGGQAQKATAAAKAAAESLGRLIERKPKLLHLREVRAQALLMADDLHGAIAELKRAAELDPKNAAVAAGVAQLLAAAGEHEEAARWEAAARERAGGKGR